MIARLHNNIGNARKDFHFKIAHKLCGQAETINACDLNTVGLNRGMLRKECIDASFGQFLSLTKWVCWKRGAYFARVNPNGTSQTCPQCLARCAKKKLSEREHFCAECGYRTHRDHAAAEMVLIVGSSIVVPVDTRGTETVCAGVLAGAARSSQVPKSRKRKVS